MRLLRILVAVVAASTLAGCAPSDPRAKILEQRAQWSVEPLDWATTPENAVQMTVRVTAPARGSDLDRLTFRIDLVGDTGAVADSEWKTIDLTELGARGSKEYMLRLARREFTIVEVRVDPVATPTPDDEQHIDELR